MVNYCLMWPMCRNCAYQDRQTELTCFSMFIFDSNHAPKFLAQFEGKMVAPPTFIDRSEGILLTSLDEKSITSVLSV